MNFSRILMAGAAGLVMSAAAAQAGTITQVYLVGGGTASVLTDLTAVNYVNQADGTTTQINLFNAAAIAAANPGYTVTLNDVKFNMATTVSTSGTLQNQASASQTFRFGLSLNSFTTNGTTTGGGASAQAVIANNYGSGMTGSQTANFGTQTYTNVAAGASVNYPNPNSTAASTLNTSDPLTFTDAATLAAFTGTGSFGLQLNTLSSQSTTGGGGNVAVNLNTYAGGAFGLVYDYTLTPVASPTTVPEPASMALLGAGLVSVGLLRRRKA